MSQQADSSGVWTGGADAPPRDLSAPHQPSAIDKPVPHWMTGSWRSTWIILLSLAALVASGITVAHRGHHGYFLATLAAAVCILAALFDAWTTRIPNPLTYTAILLGVGLNLMASGMGELLTRHPAWPLHAAIVWLAAPGALLSLVAVGICLPLAIAGLLFNVGGGDLKLMVALGAILGISDLGYVMLISITIAVIYGIINLAVAGRLNKIFRLAGLRALELFLLRKLPDDDTEGLPGSRVPMAVPLAIGLIVSQVVPASMLMGVI